MSSAVFWIRQPTLIWTFQSLQLHHCQEDLRSHRVGESLRLPHLQWALERIDSAGIPPKLCTSDLPDVLFSQEVIYMACSVLNLSANRGAHLMPTLVSARTSLPGLEHTGHGEATTIPCWLLSPSSCRTGEIPPLRESPGHALPSLSVFVLLFKWLCFA